MCKEYFLRKLERFVLPKNYHFCVGTHTHATQGWGRGSWNARFNNDEVRTL